MVSWGCKSSRYSPTVTINPRAALQGQVSLSLTLTHTSQNTKSETFYMSQHGLIYLYSPYPFIIILLNNQNRLFTEGKVWFELPSSCMAPTVGPLRGSDIQRHAKSWQGNKTKLISVLQANGSQACRWFVWSQCWMISHGCRGERVRGGWCQTTWHSPQFLRPPTARIQPFTP